MIWTTSPTPTPLALFCILLIEIIPVRASLFYCSKAIYGVPAQQDCQEVLSTLPAADLFYRYFVEQQLSTGLPQADWTHWSDRRPLGLRQKIIQVPKFWSYGEDSAFPT